MMKKVLFGAEQKGGYNNRWGWKNHQNLITEVAEINAEEGGGRENSTKFNRVLGFSSTIFWIFIYTN